MKTRETIRNMKYVFVAIVSFALIACSSENKTGIQLAADSWEDVRANGYGTVVLAYVPSDGFSYEDDEGNLTGVTIELMRDFVQFVNEHYETDITIQYHPIGHFSAFYNDVKNSGTGVFGVANVTITEARKDELVFSPSYMTNIATLITHQETEEIEDIAEIATTFEGLRALAFEGTLHQDRLEQILMDHLPETPLDFAQSNNEIIERTAASNRYFAYVDIYNYWRAAEQGAPLRRHPIGDEASEQFGIIMPPATDWDRVMNEFFSHNGGYIHSDRYRGLLEEHLGSELANLLLAQEDE